MNGTGDSGILLEVGTDEFEVLRFELAGQYYGINVAKLREVISPPQIHCTERRHPSFEGVFILRGRLVSLFNLRAVLGLPKQTPEELAQPRPSMIIVAEFNMEVSAYRVDSVERVWRVSSSKLEALPAGVGLDKVPVTAMVHVNDDIVPMLDFEAIRSEATGTTMIMPKENAPLALKRKEKRIVVAEDSATIRKVMLTALEQSGYQIAQVADNGRSAWDWLQENGADLLISDIEMPQMDGLQLCRKVRENPRLKGIPVVLFSSLVTHGNQLKGKAVGATAQISKPQLAELVDTIDRVLQLVP